MRATDALADLRRLGLPVIETREASARLGVTPKTASKILNTLGKAGLIQQLRQGLWALTPPISSDVVPPYLTAPFPAYISFWSALARHGMIEQIPRQVFVASLDRTKTIRTTVGTYSIHRLAPEVFDGYEGTAETGYLAIPEKALFDAVYLRAPRGGSGLRLPELELPAGFDERKLENWVAAVKRPRLRTLVARGIENALASANN